MPQQIIPVTDPLLFFPSTVEANTIMLINNPIPANGILNQFNIPKKGIKPTSIPISASIPR